MKVKFINRYKSITEFEETEIEEFSVFTGLNGSGKTHLLKSIKAGAVGIDSINIEDISYFNFQTFLIKNQKSVSLRSIDDDKTNAWNTVNNDRQILKNHDQKIRTIVGDIEFPYEQEVPDPSYQKRIKLIQDRINHITENHPKNRSLIKTVVSESGKYISEINEVDFKKVANYEPDDYELLENLSELFIDYQKKLVLSKLPIDDRGYGKTEEEVEDMEKNSPWKFIDLMFKEFGLEHKVIPPDIKTGDLIESPTTPFQARLLIGDEEIDFNDLSSGERILCSLAITVYQDNKSTFPKLLLLDEVDASLHPSMCENLLSVIYNVFLKNGCRVILATHSPTTVALVEEKTIFEVKRGSVADKISKISQVEAIDVLSEGYATFEEGLKITSAIKQEISLQIISEGYNINHIQKAISVIDNELLHRVNLIEAAETGQGKQQLKNAFDVMKNAKFTNKFLFVWDCDAKDLTANLEETTNFIVFCFKENDKNTKCIYKGKHAGIEDLYNDELFTEDIYVNETKPIQYGGSNTSRRFDKNKFFEKIQSINTEDTFENFKPLITKIRDSLREA